MGQFDKAPFEATRRTIDVSGDGTNNAGRDVALARDEAVATGVTINGLVILSENPMSWNPDHTNPPGGLANYYRTNVSWRSRMPSSWSPRISIRSVRRSSKR